jgi:hypothetical protein
LVETTSLVTDVAGEACDGGDPDAHNRGAVVAGDSMVMTWVAQPAEQTEYTIGIASLATPGVTASDLSIVRAVDAAPLMGSPSRVPSQATTGVSTGMTSMVKMGAPAGVKSGVDTRASWLVYCVEQVTCTMALVPMGTAGTACSDCSVVGFGAEWLGNLVAAMTSSVRSELAITGTVM